MFAGACVLLPYEHVTTSSVHDKRKPRGIDSSGNQLFDSAESFDRKRKLLQMIKTPCHDQQSIFYFFLIGYKIQEDS